MGKPWTEEQHRKFIKTMKRLYPHGTKSKAHRAKLARNLLARDPQRFEMVQFRKNKPSNAPGSRGARSNGSALQEALATLRTERVRVTERLSNIERALGAILSLTTEQK